MHTAPRPRLAVLGLDGLPLALARRLAARGAAPNLARLLPGAHALRAELPELSPVNWTSFFTAAGPEEHGVFGFTRLDPATYATALTDATCVAAPTIFQRLGARGLTSRVLNLPGTYPAQPLKGMLVAGFVAPELRGAVFPPFLAAPLAAMGYRLEADTVRGGADHDFLLADLDATLDSRRAALALLWPDLAWDLFVFVLTETDRLFHFLYDAVDDPAHPRHAGAMALLRRWDAALGDFLDRFEALPRPWRLLVLADHGFTRLETEVDLNSWLAEQGLARLTGTQAHENDATALASDSQALALDPGRIYLHTRERFAAGGVTPAQAPALAARIREGLLALTHRGRPVIRAVHDRASLYPGPMAHAAPDLLAEPQPGFSLTAKFDGRPVFGQHGRTGVHTADDAFFYDSAPGPGPAPARPRDVGKLVLDFFGVGQQT